ncbi:MAG: response regulator [Anaerolineae bacterium]|nr:response regulator [Thermoflexales bacterium]MDW8406821.1 response regulator [Anaerolineae bacterium]
MVAGDEKGTLQGHLKRAASLAERTDATTKRARVGWLRQALAHFHDLAFLQAHTRAPLVAGRFIDGPALRWTILDAIRRMQPLPETPAQSPAWRLHRLLCLRYLDGLTQHEAAAELGIGVRHFKREQQRAIEALDALIFEHPPSGRQGTSVSSAVLPSFDKPTSKESISVPSPSGSAQANVVRIEQILRATLSVLDPVLAQQDLEVTVNLEDNLPSVQINAMLARQLVINALGWLIRETRHERLIVRVRVMSNLARSFVVLELEHPLIGHRQPVGSTLEHLIRSAQADLTIEITPRQTQKLVVRLPAAPLRYILMIDDNSDMLRLVQRQLQRTSNLAFVGVSSMEQALSQIRACKPACILLDLMMPDHDGWEILGLLKTYPETASIPIVISSVLPEPDLARAMGAVAILPRPFKAAQLNALLRDIIEPASGSKP